MLVIPPYAVLSNAKHTFLHGMIKKLVMVFIIDKAALCG